MHLGEIETKIATDPNCLAVYDVTGEFDAVIIAKFRSREDMNAFVKRVNAIPHVERTYTMLALDVVKEAPGILVEKPKEDDVKLNITFGQLTDGTSYPQQIVLDVAAQNIRVTVTNSGHKKGGA